MSYEAKIIRKALEKGASQVSSKTLQINEGTKLNENLNELGKNIPVFQTWTRKKSDSFKKPTRHASSEYYSTSPSSHSSMFSIAYYIRLTLLPCYAY